MSRKELALDLLINGLLPWLGYRYLQEGQHWSEYHALLAVTIIPTLWGLLIFLRDRRLDGIAMISLVSLLLSLAMTATSADSRMLQIRESYLTGLFGLVFVASALVGRPLLWWMAITQVKDPDRRAALEAMEPARKRIFTTLTWVWGLSLLLEVGLKLWMIYALPVATVLWLGPVMLYGITGLTLIWSVWLVRSRR